MVALQHYHPSCVTVVLTRHLQDSMSEDQFIPKSFKDQRGLSCKWSWDTLYWFWWGLPFHPQTLRETTGSPFGNDTTRFCCGIPHVKFIISEFIYLNLEAKHFSNMYFKRWFSKYLFRSKKVTDINYKYKYSFKLFQDNARGCRILSWFSYHLALLRKLFKIS